MTTVTGWAAELAQYVVYETLAALGPVSAAAQLLQDGLVLGFDGYSLINVPGFAVDASYASFVAEGDPIPVRQLALMPGALGPHKIASIAVLTREMVEGSNAEQLIGEALVRAAGLALDAVLFDANAATAARPAGIRNGIAPITPSTQTDPALGFTQDLVTMGNVVGAVGGPGPYALIANPGRAIGMAMRFISQAQNVRVYASAAAGNDVIMVAAQALVAAISAQPEIETGNATSLIMNDAPLPVSTTPGSYAAGHKSLWQTDSIALKVRWPATWALRDPRGVAWMTPTW
jgi:hypothetical protein